MWHFAVSQRILRWPPLARLLIILWMVKHPLPRDLPGNPVVKTRSFHGRGQGSYGCSKYWDAACHTVKQNKQKQITHELIWMLWIRTSELVPGSQNSGHVLGSFWVLPPWLTQFKSMTCCTYCSRKMTLYSGADFEISKKASCLFLGFAFFFLLYFLKGKQTWHYFINLRV